VYDVRNLPSRSAVTVAPPNLVNVSTPSPVLKLADVTSVFWIVAKELAAEVAEASAEVADALASFALVVAVVA
jgi:hypothetical protein